jgi:NAD/NADP transhydrogenase beta subunit
VTVLLHGCRAMNRSLPNVILGNWAAKAPSVTAATGEKLEHQEIDAPSAAEVGMRTDSKLQFASSLQTSYSAAQRRHACPPEAGKRCCAGMQALTLAKKVIIVPGYGLAVASAQATVADLVSSLRKNGVDVKWALHCICLVCMIAKG